MRVVVVCITSRELRGGAPGAGAVIAAGLRLALEPGLLFRHPAASVADRAALDGGNTTTERSALVARATALLTGGVPPAPTAFRRVGYGHPTFCHDAGISAVDLRPRSSDPGKLFQHRLQAAHRTLERLSRLVEISELLVEWLKPRVQTVDVDPEGGDIR